MTRIIRNATIQVRVSPAIKAASEFVLWKIGLNMSEAIELFLRRLIIDERLPFDVISLENFRLTQIAKLKDIKVGIDEIDRGEAKEWDAEAIKAAGRESLRQRLKSRDLSKKENKKFSTGSTTLSKGKSPRRQN